MNEPAAADPQPSSTRAAPESLSQLVVALAIIVGLVVIACAMIWAACVNAAVGAALGIGTAVGTIIGALAAALNAPSGIARVLTAAKASPPSPTTTEGT